MLHVNFHAPFPRALDMSRRKFTLLRRYAAVPRGLAPRAILRDLIGVDALARAHGRIFRKRRVPSRRCWDGLRGER